MCSSQQVVLSVCVCLQGKPGHNGASVAKPLSVLELSNLDFKVKSSISRLKDRQHCNQTVDTELKENQG